MKTEKIIRDSVHGNIVLSRPLIEHIVDTPYFQRLRRIEQTSIRAMYPCARHDRFTHSLGVYHVGTKIVDQLEQDVKDIHEVEDSQRTCIFQSYVIACLLHDIAHAPFSHTFEEYYGTRGNLCKKLCKLLKEELQKDRLDIDGIKQHEYASAILVFQKFKKTIESKLNGNVELVCRMIIGAQFKQKDAYHQVCDCFIKLLHGEVDADRLDYACRDGWSSGYKTISIDINRVIQAMHIKYCKSKKSYELCFDHNVVGDIRNIMELKRFQVANIFNHHTIVYDKELLVQAAEHMAATIYTRNRPSVALTKIICLDAVTGEKDIEFSGKKYKVKHICDDDLFFLMKQSDNEYFHEFVSRQYTRFALWKSPADFYNFYPNMDKSISISHASFIKEAKKALKKLKLIDVDKVLTREVEYKETANIDETLILIRDDIKPYSAVCHENFKVYAGTNKFKFTYLYLPKPEDLNDIPDLRQKAIDCLKPVVEQLFKPVPKPKRLIKKGKEKTNKEASVINS